MMYHNTKHPVLVWSAAMLLACALGSIHAFSVLLVPLETTFDIPRSQASLVYSLALVTLAACVLLGPRFYPRWSAAVFVMGVGLIASVGCLLAGTASSMVVVYLGYSLLFGGANGLGYGFALQLPAQAMPEHKGLAMGAVTAAYALGAILFPLLLVWASGTGGWRMACTLLAVAVLLLALVSALLLSRASAHYQTDETNVSVQTNISGSVLSIWWLAYCSAVIAGLMVIGHATGIADASGMSPRWVVLAPTLIALFNLVGSVSGGVLADKFSARVPLIALPALSCGSLIVMALLLQPVVAMAGLAIIGFTYGGVIAIYPALIAKRFGSMQGAVVYGRVFTAWAVAGLAGPGLAGLLFDRSGNYTLALGFAAVMAAVSVIFGHRASSLRLV
ncbi:MFS transporter [Candidatus Spongiihabitans sp.]|uniref:MFS transporter n=1 Tax=Candidatus Spongiihabitans sp. TaxID=3101308 RepID=UPI003C7057D3